MVKMNSSVLMLRRALAVSAIVGVLVACGSGSKSDLDAANNAIAPVTDTPPQPTNRGVLESVADVAVVTKVDSNAAALAANVDTLAGPALCDVKIRYMVHSTVGPRNEAAKASAALLVPTGVGCAGPFPIIAYARGTSRDRNRTLARLGDPETTLLINMFAARGYVVVATDYLGYAGSDFSYHPYLDADTAAVSMIDSIRAAQSALRTAAVAVSGKIFLTGYSQGGHAALAAQREIERTTGLGFAIAAVGPMSGPYDLALTLQQGAAINLLPSLANEDGLADDDRIRLVISNGLVELVGNIAASGPIANLLAGESVIDYKPLAPVLLCGGARDPTVPFVNATAASTAFTARGASNIVVDIDREPAFAALRPAPGVPVSALRSYHNRVVPPLCFQIVRDRLFEVYR